MKTVILPRVIRLRDAPDYLGMDRNRFDREVRPSLIEIPIGSQGIGFDRLDLDAWFDDYKLGNGRQANRKGGEAQWRTRKVRVVSTRSGTRGTSTRGSEEEEFARALELAKSGKQNGI